MIDDDPLQRCYLAALRILQHRWNSEMELRRKLGAKRFTNEVIEPVLIRLRDEKWLDEARFAGAMVRERLRRGSGRRRIASQLSAAGVDRQTAATALAEHVDEASEIAAATAACTKRIRHLSRRHGSDWIRSSIGRMNLTAWLLKQGYDGALVSRTIRELTGGDSDGFSDA